MSKKSKKNSNSKRNFDFLKDLENSRSNYKFSNSFKNAKIDNRTIKTRLNQLRKTNNFGRR